MRSYFIVLAISYSFADEIDENLIERKSCMVEGDMMILVGDSCSPYDDNVKCVQRPGEPRCECANGFYRGSYMTCICPETMTIADGICKCPEG